MERGKKTSASQEIRVFATDLYDYIWTKHQFCNESLENKFAEQLSLKLLETEEAKNSPFNEDIGKAVLCSQYLLREPIMDLFRHFKEYMTLSKKSFIYIINLIYHIWSKFRSDILHRFIDFCAILAEAVLFCDSQAKPLIELNKVPDILIGFFEIHLSKPFLKKGGWQQLQVQAQEYGRLLPLIITYVNRCNVPYVILYYDCRLIKFLRESPVAFPVQVSWFCKDCKSDSDSQSLEILSPECTIEELMTRYSLQEPPWKKDSNQNPVQVAPSASSESEKPILFERFYVFLGKSQEKAENLNEELKRTPRKKRKHKKSVKSETECSSSK